MTPREKLMQKLGLTEDDFQPQPTAQEIAEEAYLTAQYNAVLIELMMEDYQ